MPHHIITMWPSDHCKKPPARYSISPHKRTYIFRQQPAKGSYFLPFTIHISGMGGSASRVETRIKEPTFLDNSLLKALIFCLLQSIYQGWGKCEFDKDMHKLYIYSSYIFSYHLF